MLSKVFHKESPLHCMPKELGDEKLMILDTQG